VPAFARASRRASAESEIPSRLVGDASGDAAARKIALDAGGGAVDRRRRPFLAPAARASSRSVRGSASRCRTPRQRCAVHGFREREPWIIGARGPRADHDRVRGWGGVAQPVVCARAPRTPSASASTAAANPPTRGDPAVERRGRA